MKTILTEITIAAPIGTVWHTLTDFAAYPDWNPFIRRITGLAQPHRRIEIHLALSKQRTVVIRPVVTVAEPPTDFAWLGHLGIPGLFDGRHFFSLRATAIEHTLLIHGEHFSGILPNALGRRFGARVRQGFIAMNSALKDRVERGSGPAL